MLERLTTAKNDNHRLDPTRSVGLRRAGRGLVNGRVFELNRQLRQLLQEQDLPGLQKQVALDLWQEPIGRKIERAEAMLRATVGGVLTDPSTWLSPVISKAVQLGIGQAGKELSANISSIDATDIALYHTTWASTEIAGISGETQRRLLHNINRAMERQQRPALLMREVRATLEKITRLRLNMLVNASMVRSVNAGKLIAYKANGITQVGVQAERLPRSPSHQPRAVDSHHQRRHIHLWRDDEPELVNILTAGDDDVCEDCEDIAEDGPYDIDAARDLIPAHPNCRCAFVPWGDKRYAEQQREREEEE